MEETAQKYTTIISAEEVKSNLENPNWIFIDCRFSLKDKEGGRKEFIEEHIPGAQYAHLDDDLSGEIIPGKTGRHPLPKVESFVELLGRLGIDNTSQVIVYDQSHGGIAARLWWMLNWVGHSNVAVLNGGWQYWKANKYPVSSEVITPAVKTYTPTVQEHLVAGVDAVEVYYGDDDFCLIDSRAHERYLGKVEPIDPIAGHIPTAINFPFAENLNEQGLWKSAEEIATRFEDVKENKPIFYCGSGVTACHNILALKYAGMGDFRLYPGSWSEWIIDESRPIETMEEKV